MIGELRSAGPGADDADVSVLLELVAVAPHALGGILLRAWPGPQRERLCAELAQLLGQGVPSVRLPLHASDDRLLGGLALGASLQHGRPLLERGLLAAADGGMLVLPTAERLEAHRAAMLCGALDRASVSLERDGLSSQIPCRAGILALDEGLEDERVNDALRERLAFHVGLAELQLSAAGFTELTATTRAEPPALDPAAAAPSERDDVRALAVGVTRGSRSDRRVDHAASVLPNDSSRELQLARERAQGAGAMGAGRPSASDSVLGHAAGAGSSHSSRELQLARERAQGAGAMGGSRSDHTAAGAESTHSSRELGLARERVERARACWRFVVVDESWVLALCEAAAALGVSSIRAPLLAARAAQVHAALAGRAHVEEDDVLVAARWVLGPRATQLPTQAEASAAPEPRPDSHEQPTEEQAPALDSVQELVVAAAKSGIPRQLFASLAAVPARRLQGLRVSGKAGAQHTAAGGGRPSGVRSAPPSAAERLNLVETLRAAAPWQRLRGRRPGYDRVLLRKDDLRVTRYERRSATTVIFSVDASGSAALQRLAEAKGAVEQLLIDCYARRDHVALVAFRERAASLLLAPTRSLARVRRSLAQLAGGGATPLASGIDAASALALTARKQGSLPIVVLMTDARANVARDGEHGSSCAMQDALAAARDLRAQLIASLFLDTSPRPREQAQRLAAELGAHYLPLPYLDAAGISAEVRALSTACRNRGA